MVMPRAGLSTLVFSSGEAPISPLRHEKKNLPPLRHLRFSGRIDRLFYAAAAGTTSLTSSGSSVIMSCVAVGLLLKVSAALREPRSIGAFEGVAAGVAR